MNSFKGCLAEGKPFVFGFTVYTSFMSDEVNSTGVVPMPDTWKDRVLGGHAVLCVGYDDDQSQFIVRNSWDEDWGNNGYFYMPYAYLLNDSLSDDFWVIAWVE
jgi:C1A family cysteine protease